MDDRFLKRAIELAANASCDGRNGPFGAVIVKDGEIITEAYNQVRELHDPSAHAEIQAIRAAGQALGSHSLAGCEIYASCEPCPMCLAAICWARLDAVFYACSSQEAANAGFDDSLIYRELRKPWDQRTIQSMQACEEEGALVFRDWVRNPNRMEY